MALNLAPFGRWTLRNKAAQRRLALRSLDISPARQETPVESQFVSDVRKSAEEAFASGLYCAESVVLALAKAQGVESDLLPKVATAFCSGMSRTCGTCGALTGAIMGER